MRKENKERKGHEKREMARYKAGSKEMKPCRYKMKGMKNG